jgi:phosphotransacetylase
MADPPTERDYPVGSPFAADYKGQPYNPPQNALARDYPVGHPKAADSAANIAESAADTADLLRLHPPGAPPATSTTPAAADPSTVDAAQLAAILGAGNAALS